MCFFCLRKEKMMHLNNFFSILLLKTLSKEKQTKKRLRNESGSGAELWKCILHRYRIAFFFLLPVLSVPIGKLKTMMYTVFHLFPRIGRIYVK